MEQINNRITQSVNNLFGEQMTRVKKTQLIAQNDLEFIEYRYPCNTVMLPVVMWLGKDAALRVAQSDWLTDDIRIIFGLTSKYDQVITQYIIDEAGQLLHFNPQNEVVGHMNPEQLAGILHAGCGFLKERLKRRRLHWLRKLLNKETKAFGKDITFSKVGRYLLNGRMDKDWYAATFKELTLLLPMVDPQLLFNLMAGTSISTSLQANVKLFFRALGQYKNNTDKLVYNSAIGDNLMTRFDGFLPAAVYQLTYFKDNQELRGRKINNFAKAMLGNWDAIVVDIWIMRAFGSDRKYQWRNRAARSRSPEKKLYDAIEYYIQRTAWFIGMDPRECCSMIWGGIRTESTGRRERTRYTPYITKYIHGDSLFLDPKEIMFGAEGIYLGSQATVDYRNHLAKNGAS